MGTEAMHVGILLQYKGPSKMTCADIVQGPVTCSNNLTPTFALPASEPHSLIIQIRFAGLPILRSVISLLSSSGLPERIGWGHNNRNGEITQLQSAGDSHTPAGMKK